MITLVSSQKSLPPNISAASVTHTTGYLSAKCPIKNNDYGRFTLNQKTFKVVSMLPYIHHLSFIKKNQKSNIGWPQQPLKEKMLKCNMIFYDTVKTFLFSKHQNQVILVLKLLNSRTWITLKSSEVIFQDLKTSPASLTSVASVSSVASTASKVQ